MNRNQAKVIDAAVMAYLRTGDKKYETAYLKAVIPFVKMRAVVTCTGSSLWCIDDLYSILLEDAWRLFKIYKPKKGQEFHYLLLHQLNNKIINYINNTTGRTYQLCFVCSERAKKKEKTCANCGSSLKKPNMYTQAYSDAPKAMSYRPDYLKEIENKEMVKKVLSTVQKTNPKTYRILVMLMMGERKSEISRALDDMAQNALNNRIRKCERILNDVRE